MDKAILSLDGCATRFKNITVLEIASNYVIPAVLVGAGELYFFFFGQVIFQLTWRW